ncbi:MAG: protein phosphatase 2C domain-containing protein [Nannocystaceae bacterium]
MRTEHDGRTDTGRTRSHNEDAFRADEALGLFVVCDGVGGRARGEVASQETVDLIWEWVHRELPALRALPPGAERDGLVGSMLRSAVQNACYMVHGMGELDPERRGMSTTASVVLIVDALAIVAQVGDSRVYHARGDDIRQLTEDHTLVALQVKSGMITPEQARTSRMKNMITRAVGQKDYVEVDIRTVTLRAGDRMLLCSDGLHDYLDGAATLAELFRLDVKVAARRAIQLANDGGGKDNITALFIACLGERGAS